MPDAPSITRFFGDRERKFALPWNLIPELERKTGSGHYHTFLNAIQIFGHALAGRRNRSIETFHGVFNAIGVLRKGILHGYH